MAANDRRDPGGFAYGELHESEPAVRESGTRGRDTPLSPRGRSVWRITVTLLVAAGAALLIAIFISMD